jgi:hypothetical protein
LIGNKFFMINPILNARYYAQWFCSWLCNYQGLIIINLSTYLILFCKHWEKDNRCFVEIKQSRSNTTLLSCLHYLVTISIMLLGNSSDVAVKQIVPGLCVDCMTTKHLPKKALV